jgi:glycosyltransferase involved in cell wall biosynthesis
MVLSVCRQADRADISGDVEVVVCDNASTDETAQVVASLQQQTRVKIHYRLNSENIGVARNLLKTAELASGDFWMFYGDDDLMPDGVLLPLLQHLRNNCETCVIVFHPLNQIEGSHTTTDATAMPCTMTVVARDYFYFMGNAGRQAIKSDLAQQVLRKLDASQFQTAWPQTELAFRVMATQEKEFPALAIPLLCVMSPSHVSNTMYTSWYVLYGAGYALYEVALKIKALVGKEVFEAACSHLFAWGRVITNARIAFAYAAFSDSPEEVESARNAARSALRNANYQTLIPLLFFWLLLLPSQTVKQIMIELVLMLPSASAKKNREIIRVIKENALARKAVKKGISSQRLYKPGDL